MPQPRCIQPPSSVQDRPRTPHVGANPGEHAAVNMEAVEKVANAVLYEGYMLYPYTPSSVKNRQRWNFGVLSPPAHDTSEMQTQCLVVGHANISAKTRFLQDTA